MPTPRRLELEMLPQPDDTTCGPTCLHAVYRYFNDLVPLDQVISEVEPLPEGGTLAVRLGCHALRRGYHATIYTYNLQVFDPTWFANPAVDVIERLQEQRKAKPNPKLAMATDTYIDYCRLGGILLFEELNTSLIRKFLYRGIPILTGLSATYLYRCARELNDQYDDVRGESTGHFVVLCGYHRKRREVQIADPLQDNPLFGSHYYAVGLDRLIGAILIGIVTYDANLLVIQPRDKPS